MHSILRLSLILFFSAILVPATVLGQKSDNQKNYNRAQEAFKKYEKNPDKNRSSLEDAETYIHKAYDFFYGLGSVDQYILLAKIDRAVASEFLRKDLFTKSGYNRDLTGKIEVTENFFWLYKDAYNDSKTDSEKELIDYQIAEHFILLSEFFTVYSEQEDFIPAFYVGIQYVAELNKLKAKYPTFKELGEEVDRWVQDTGTIALRIKNPDSEVKYDIDRFFEVYGTEKFYIDYLHSSTTLKDPAVERAWKQYSDNELVLNSILKYYKNTEQYEEGIRFSESVVAEGRMSHIILSEIGNYHADLIKVYSDAGNSQAVIANRNAALRYYQDILMENPDSFEILYNVAFVYFRVAADFHKQYASFMKSGQSEFEKQESERLYSALVAEMEQSFPYLVRAEKLNPNDSDVLGSLVMIYDLRGDAPLQKIFQDRAERIERGETIGRSYFKEMGL